jgi:endonuclease/exonuclease/phosphatase (EEP) superfamily protein YafD
MKAAGLQNANTLGLPSYPSRAPRMELDFVLYGDGINVTDFQMPKVTFSDHLPLVCDFEVKNQSQRAA